MGTPFDEVIDMAMIVIDDYKLNKIYVTNRAIFDTLFEGYLKKSIPKFTPCFQSLEIDTLAKSFISTLTPKEIDIISDLVVITWFTSKVQDVTEFQGHMSDSEFKKHSEANNLAKKKDYLDGLREKLKQDITDYQIQNLDKCGL